MKSNVILALSFLVLFLSCKSSKSIPDIEEEEEVKVGIHFSKSDNLGSILDLAEAEGKLVFLEFYADWCLPCKMMEEDVFTDQHIGEFMNSNFINYKVDGEKGNGPDLALLFQLQAYPTLLFLDSTGKILVSKVGAAYHTELTALANEALMM